MTVALVMVATVEVVLILRAIDGGWYGGFASDLDPYLGFTRSWLAGEGWYLPAQLAGSYVVEDVGANVYPPTLLYLTVPFTLGLPLVLWWAVPIGLLAAALYHARPAWWSWPLLALVLVYPRTWTVVVAGNPAMWAIAFAVAGVVWSWPAVGAALKLTFAPLALIGVRHRSWWFAAGIAFLASLPFGSMWLDYLTVIGNAESSRGFGYVLGEWPIALGLVAVATSGRSRHPVEAVDVPEDVGGRAERATDADAVHRRGVNERLGLAPVDAIHRDVR